MRLQGAIFDFHGTILDDKGNPLPGVDRVLSMMKMEDVWMYLVCDGDPAPVRSALEGAGLWGRFRGLISAAEHGGDPLDPELYEKTVRRLRYRPGGAAGGAEEKRLLCGPGGGGALPGGCRSGR